MPLHPCPLRRGACLAAFADLLTALPVGMAVRLDLARRYGEPWRCYHDAAHPGLLWHRHLAAGGAAAETSEGREIALAIAFHDAVLDRRGCDNEARSAALLLEVAPHAVRAATAVRATADHPAYRGDDPVVLRLLDLDLSPLAERPGRFRANTRRLRHEAADLDGDDFASGVRRHLDGLLSRGPIFRTSFARPWEAAARANLQALLDGTSDWLRQILPHAPTP